MASVHFLCTTCDVRLSRESGELPRACERCGALNDVSAPTPNAIIDRCAACGHDQLYFQKEGIAEAEFETDIPTALRKVYFAISGGAPPNKWLEHKPANAKLLDGMIDPQPFPDWMSEKDLQIYSEAFQRGGFRGPLNRYRAQSIDFEEMAEFAGKPVTQPSCFIAGERDPVRSFVPGMDLYANPGVACIDFRGSVILPGIGHWVQQEAPAETTAALQGFLKGL